MKKRNSKKEISVVFRFSLSKKGQKDDLKSGGSGSRSQSAKISLPPGEIDLFEIDGDGCLFIDGDPEFDSIPNAQDFVAKARDAKTLVEDIEEARRRLRGERRKLKISDDVLFRRL
jgi:hypothetical protein